MTEHDLKVIAPLGATYSAWRFQVADAPGLPRWWGTVTGRCTLFSTQRK